MPVDILMAISNTSGAWVAAEGKAVLQINEQSNGATTLFKDTLAEDFQTGKFFDVLDFSLAVGLEDHDESDASTLEKEQLLKKLEKMVNRDKLERQPGGKDRPKKSKQKFGKWLKGRSVTRRDGTAGFPLDFQEFKLTRPMDEASVFLFDACCNRLTLSKAALLKRKAGGHNIPETYIRLDFRDVLITSLDWDVDDTIKETVKFICRAAKVTYRPQLNTGELGSAISRQWDPLGKLPTGSG